jgi:hypothetical protein
VQEEGFHLLLGRAHEHVDRLIREFSTETEHGLRCWLIELIGAARSPAALPFLAEQLRSPDAVFREWASQGLEHLGTRAARQALWGARSWSLPLTPRRRTSTTASLQPSSAAVPTPADALPLTHAAPRKRP